MMSGESSPADSDSEGPELLAQLRDDLCLKHMVKSKFDKTPISFLPRNILKTILSELPQSRKGTRDEVRTILQILNVDPVHVSRDDRALADYILNSAKTLFLLLIHIEFKQLHTAMTLFKHNNIDDSYLPCEVWDEENLRLNIEKHPFRLMEKSKLTKPQSRRNMTKTNWTWSAHAIHKFQDKQWQFLAPMISSAKETCNFTRSPMPFIEKGDSLSGGARGVVSRYTVHPAHFEDDSRRVQTGSVHPSVVAVKAFRKSGENVIPDWIKEVGALVRMNRLNQPHIVRFITAFQRGERDDLEHYVVFEWADGGNLRDLWSREVPELSAPRIRWMMQQLYGLAQALAAAHYLEDNRSYRHGDLKPANILWFRDNSPYGTLKIGDWGEAKEHKHVTALRHNNTTAKASTVRYEPPETARQTPLSHGERHVRSRLYDIWGFGCIALEFVIWLMYGDNELQKFNDSNLGQHGLSDTFYKLSSSPGTEASVDDAVVHWMTHMAKDDACRPDKTALGDLLKIVRTGLLVVQLPKDGGSKPVSNGHRQLSGDGHWESGRPGDSGSELHAEPLVRLGPEVKVTKPEVTITEPAAVESGVSLDSTPKYKARLRADELEILLERIVHNKATQHYWQPVQSRKGPPTNLYASSHLTVSSVSSGPDVKVSGLHAPQLSRINYEHPPLDPEDWTRSIDNTFAAVIVPELGSLGIKTASQLGTRPSLCEQCRDFRDHLQDGSCDVDYDQPALQQHAAAKTCDLCILLWEACGKFSDRSRKKIQFQTAGSALRVLGARQPVLSLFRDNGKPTH